MYNLYFVTEFIMQQAEKYSFIKGVVAGLDITSENVFIIHWNVIRVKIFPWVVIFLYLIEIVTRRH